MAADRKRTSDWLAAFSLANLAFLRCWAELLDLSVPQTYWLKTLPTPLDYTTLLLDVLLLGAAQFWLIRSLRTTGVWTVCFSTTLDWRNIRAAGLGVTSCQME